MIVNYKKAIVDGGKYMLSSGLTVGTWGNISVCDRESGLVYLTPSGMPYNTLEEKDIPVLKLDGTPVDAFRKPTIEKDMHLGIYNAYPQIGAVVHTHPKWSMIFACVRKTIPLICDEAAQFIKGDIECTEYALPGSKELAVNCIEKLKSSNACLIASHGSVCLGGNLKEAFDVATVLEYTAELYYKILSMGMNPALLSKDDISFMYDFVHTKYGQK